MADLPLSRRELLILLAVTVLRYPRPRGREILHRLTAGSMSALGGAAAVTAFGGAAMQSGTPAVTDVDTIRLDRVGRYETGEFDGGPR